MHTRIWPTFGRSGLYRFCATLHHSTINTQFSVPCYIYNVYGNDEFALLCVNGMCTVHVCLYTQTHCVQWNPTALWHELIFGLNTMRL